MSANHDPKGIAKTAGTGDKKPMAARRSAGRRVLASFQTAAVTPAFGLTAAAVCLGIAPVAHAALEKSLHEADTSIGLLPTNATNIWKLETDPVVPDTTDLNIQDYIPVSGVLNNTYDATQFHLALDPVTNNYALGYSVESIEPFQVTSFDVVFNNGGYDAVSQTADPTVPVVTPINDPSGGEAGIVDNITFAVVPSEENEDLPANQDQDFFFLNLLSNSGGAPLIVPFDYSASGGSITIEIPGEPSSTMTISGTDVITSYVPEPSTVGVFSIVAAGLFMRPKKKA
jgi:hypothetical protein